MYNNLKEILIICNLWGQDYKIIFNNDSKQITINDTTSYVLNNYQNFLDRLFRIIRTWPIDKKSVKRNSIIKIVESDKTYIYYIGNEIPSNYDSFIDLIMEFQ